MVPTILSRALYSDSRREPRREQPRPPVPADPETRPRIGPVEIPARAPGPVIPDATGAARPVQPGCQSRREGRRGGQDGGLHLAVLLDQLPRHDAEDLLDALAALGADLVARVPPGLLAPEARGALGRRAARLGGGGLAGREEATPAAVVVVSPKAPERAARGRAPRQGRREVAARGGGRGRRGVAEARGEVLGDVVDAALEGDLALGGLAGDDVGLGADNVQDDVVGQVAAQFGEPGAHVGEGLGVGDGVAEDAGVGASVIEPGDGSKSFLAGWWAGIGGVG